MKNTDMNVYLIANTTLSESEKHPTFNTLSEQFNYFGGLSAGICYMPGTFEDLRQKPLETTLKRADGTKAGGHHSVFEHSYVSLYLENIPKLFAMLLNNEKTYVTSEKSARYTKMQMSGVQSAIFQKWYDKLVEKITKKYGNEKYFEGTRIAKLAQENARYFLSVYTPTNMMYTVSYRQINYMYHWMKEILNNNNCNELLFKLKPYIEDFCNSLENLGIIDEKLANDQKNRTFSMIGNKVKNEYFGDTYCTHYDGTFAQYAQAQRHRTINYDMVFNNDNNFYVPKIIKDEPALVEEWLKDMKKVKNEIPQGKLITINEIGTPENFILKAKERLCTCAQLEIADQTKQTLEKYIKECKDQEIVNYLKIYNNGARCTFPDYKCPTPCAFKDGIKLDRNI